MGSNKDFPPGAYIALTGKRILTALKQGYRPTKDISISQLYKLSDLFRDAANDRMAHTREKNLAHNGGVQHANLIFDRAQLTFLVACLENHVEPESCKGLTEKLARERDSLVGDAEEDESAPLLSMEAKLFILKDRNL